MPNVYIYGLTDPRTGEVRYVGATRDTAKRMMGHVAPGAATGPTVRAKWLRELREHGLRPGLAVLETADESNWQEREKFWIARLRSEGTPLTNMTRGGDGGTLPARAERVGRRHVPCQGDERGHRMKHSTRRRLARWQLPRARFSRREPRRQRAGAR